MLAAQPNPSPSVSLKKFKGMEVRERKFISFPCILVYYYEKYKVAFCLTELHHLMQGLRGEPTPGTSRSQPGEDRVPLAPLDHLTAARRLSAAYREPAGAEAEASAPRPAGHDPHDGNS